MTLRVRTFGFFGWAICASFVSMMISKNINMVFWLCSGFAFILLLLTKFVDVTPIQLKAEHHIKKEEPFSFKLMIQLLKMPQIWYFMLYVAGVASIYDVFDQQFANFFTSFFKTQEEGQKVFGFVTTFGESLNAIVMFIAPWIVFKIGSKNVLLLAGLIMTIRITGSSFAVSYTEVILLKMLHMFESPPFKW